MFRSKQNNLGCKRRLPGPEPLQRAFSWSRNGIVSASGVDCAHGSDTSIQLKVDS